LVFICSHTKALQWVFIKVSQHSSQDQDVKNKLITSQNLINTPRKIKKGLDRKEGKKKKIRKDKKKNNINKK
jgi:hypothetical protein